MQIENVRETISGNTQCIARHGMRRKNREVVRPPHAVIESGYSYINSAIGASQR